MRTDMGLRCLKSSLIFALLLVLMLFTGRAVLLLFFTDDTVRQTFAHDIPRLLLKGLLFDIKATCIAAAIPVLFSLLSWFHPKISRFWLRILPYLLAFFSIIVLAATVANVYFFKVYERQFDVFVFGLWEEDTRAVLLTIWADYPILRALLLLGISGSLFVAFYRWLLRDKLVSRLPTKGQLAIYSVLMVLALTLGIRGSLGKFPLRQDDAQISTSPQINQLVANALIALDWARKEYRNSAHFAPASDTEGQKLIAKITGQSHINNSDLTQLMHTTPLHADSNERAPNVVFALMESMSSHLLLLDNPQRDLLGNLKTHFAQDWLYPRFVSEGDGTSDSLHRLLIRSPLLNLSQSSAKNKMFISNAFTPYRQAGYDVVFITAGNGGWRNFDAFLRHLGVDEMVDENFLKQRYPEAIQSAATWGVADEFMFRYAQERLQAADAKGKPVFIMMLSVTNHPPYRLPPPHTTRDFALNDDEIQRLSGLGKPDMLKEILNTYRYANDQLGQFITHAKQHAPHTIIAATGDHNMRAIGYPKPHEQALGHAVPFYLFVPEHYRHNAVYQPQRAGSHKDIMPTLYELSLPQQTYYRTGCNLTAANTHHNPWCGYGFNAEVIISEYGFYRLGENTFYEWDKQHVYPIAQSQASTQPQPEMAERANTYPAFLQWQINHMVAGRKP